MTNKHTEIFSFSTLEIQPWISVSLIASAEFHLPRSLAWLCIELNCLSVALKRFLPCMLFAQISFSLPISSFLATQHLYLYHPILFFYLLLSLLECFLFVVIWLCFAELLHYSSSILNYYMLSICFVKW